MRRKPPTPDEAQAAAALSAAARMVPGEAARLKITERTLDAQGVAGLAACQFLASGKRLLSELRTIVRRRLIDDLRAATGFRPRYRHRQVPPTVSIEDLDPGLGEHPLGLPAPREGPAPGVLDRCAELFALPLNDQQMQVLELLAVGWTRKRIYKRLRISESRLCQVIAEIRKAHEREGDRAMREVRDGRPSGARQVDVRPARQAADRHLPVLPAPGRARAATSAIARALAGSRSSGRARSRPT